MTRLTGRLLLLFLLLLAAVAALYQAVLGDLPAPREIEGRLVRPSVRFTDRDGRLLYDLLDAETGRHMALPLDQIPLTLQQATIATEDKNFYQNPGVDLTGIIRAFWVNLRGGEVLAGGSTITQQVARNLLLEPAERGERTLRRKLRESWLAWRLARQYEKEEILALYLNQMYYGAMAYGVEAAAQTYFGKTAADLTLAESALLAGLPQAPALYNPYVDPATAVARRSVVLDLMRKAGAISDSQRDLADREPLYLAATPYPVIAPHFVLLAQAELDARFSPEQIAQLGGLTVRTTLDLNWQEQAERIVGEQLLRLNRPLDGGPGHNAGNAALVALDSHDGDILAFVGSADFFDPAISGAIDMATTPRQPGSALKPVIYAAAMSPDRPIPWTAASMIPDVRTVFITHENQPYVPVNFSRNEHGPVLLRQALASSLNIPAVAILDAVGVETALRQAADLGLPIPDDPDEVDLSYALGGSPVSPFDLTTAYAAFANGGSRITPRLILEVTDAAGEKLYAAPPPVSLHVLDERVAWLISDILSDDDARRLSFGANSLLQLDRPAAAKTGTTNDFRDNWTVGYTPDLVVGVWVGNADNSPMRDVTGISGAGPIWHHFMRAVLAGQPKNDFARPPGLVQAEVCALSGLLPGDDCPYRRREWFLAGTQPVRSDTYYQRVTLDRRTGRLADESTPPERRVEQLALDLPPLFHPWARAEGLLLLDDLLLAGGVEEAAVSGVISPTAPLRLISPDLQAIYRLSPELPPQAQQLRFQAVADLPVGQVTFWLDDALLATVTTPPFETWWPLAPGRHTLWAVARDAAGATINSAPLSFEVRPPAD